MPDKTNIYDESIYEEKYCAYLRKSRADRDAELRGEGETLARHKQLLTEFSAKMHVSISKFYCEVVSGDTIANRPVMQELLADVEKGRWKGVFVVEVERLARGNTRDQGIVSDTFKYSDTQIITPAKIYDPNNEFDEEYFEFGLFMARREYKTINRRLQRGRIASVKEGKYVGSTAPFGYRRVKIKHDKGYTLEIVPEQAEVVRQVFEWYCHGELLPDGTYQRLGTDSIASRLDLLGIKPAINDFWSKASISDMLRNITYCGKVFFGQRKYVKSFANGNIITVRQNNDDFICCDGLHEAIIPQALFDLAQSVRSQNKKNTLPAKMVLQNPLSGLVYCQKCGKLMTRLGENSRNKYATLKCPNKYCDNISSPLFLVEKQVLTFLRNWLNTYDLKQDSFQPFPIEKDILSKKRSLSQLNSEYESLQKQLNKTYDFLEQGVYSLDVFSQRQQSIKKELAALKDKMHSVEDELSRIDALVVEKEQFAPKVRALLDSYDTNTAEANNRILHEVIEKITYIKTEPNRRGNLYNANFSLNIYPRVPL